MVKIISRSKDDNEREKLLSVIETITLDIYPNAVITRQGVGRSYHPRRYERFIYTVGVVSIPQMEGNEVSIMLDSEQPRVSISNIEAYDYALRLCNAYEDATKREFKLSIP